jgi:hypothetical protein
MCSINVRGQSSDVVQGDDVTASAQDICAEKMKGSLMLSSDFEYRNFLSFQIFTFFVLGLALTEGKECKRENIGLEQLGIARYGGGCSYGDGDGTGHKQEHVKAAIIITKEVKVLRPSALSC